MTEKFPYERLGPRTVLLRGRDGLWLGADHLLAVKNRRFVEEYLRFDYREIQAIIIQKKLRIVIPLYGLLASMAALVAAFAGSASDRLWLQYSGWAVVVGLLVYWIELTVRRSCGCHLQTAVGLYELSGLYRLPVARKAVATLEERIAAVQGVLPEGWTPDEEPGLPPPSLPGRSGRLIPFLACCTLLLDALFSWLIRDYGSLTAVRVLNQVMTLLAVVMPVLGIITTRKNPRVKSLRFLFLIAILAVGAANYGNAFVAQLVTAMRNPAAADAVPAINQFFFWMNEIAELTLGTLGLYFLFEATRYPSAP